MAVRMKNFIIVFGIAGLSFAVGMMYSESHQLCPGDQECTLARIASTSAEKAQFCADLMAEPEEKECLPDVQYHTETIIIPCDCDPDFEEGRVKGWSEAVLAEQAVTSQKKQEEYCDVHFCRTPILRNTRPTTK